MAEESRIIDNFWEIHTILSNDVHRCINVLKDEALTDEEERAFWSRALMRSVFALIEGSTYNMAGFAFMFRHIGGVFTPEEIEELEVEYDFYGFQEVPIELTKTQMLHKTQRAFTLYAHAFHGGDFLLTDMPEWEWLEELYSWKLLWTHVRKEEHLTLTDFNRALLTQVSYWFMKCVLELLDQCQESGEKFLERLENETGPIM